MTSLDIGCGFAHRGSVNVDIKKPCDILCDVHYLPFRSRNSPHPKNIDMNPNPPFMKAFLSHVVEHVKNPVKVLDEALRVARFVEVRTPINWHPYGHFDKTHLWFFPTSWFREYAKSRNLGIRGKLRFDRDRTFFWLAVEICVYLVKK